MPLFRDLRRRMMACLYDRIQARHEEWARSHKRELFAGVAGTVLELGPGTGVNFAYYPKDVLWVGVEPNVHMHSALRARAAEHGITSVDVRTLTAEGMDVAPASVDVVVSTLVLCSVTDPAAVLADVRRVLRPGGRLLFLEHVGAPRGTGLRRAQRLVRPFWRFLADGCRPDNDTAAALRAAGFRMLDLRELRLPRSAGPRLVEPHVIGVALA